MKETENHLLEHLSIFDSWLKLCKAPCRGSVSHFQVKTEVNVGIFTHLRLSWLESPENNTKGIKSLRQIENKAWSVTVGKFLQPIKLNRSGFFPNQFISQSSDILLEDETCLTCYHGNTEKYITTSTQWQNIKNIEARQYNVYHNFESSNESLRSTFFHCS